MRPDDFVLFVGGSTAASNSSAFMGAGGHGTVNNGVGSGSVDTIGVQLAALYGARVLIAVQACGRMRALKAPTIANIPIIMHFRRRNK
jgi:hypothetical protein